MAKQVIWSVRALNDRKEILGYWIERNKSNSYSKKLNFLFKEAVKLIAKHPKIGKLTDEENVRIKIIRNYFIIYEETETHIHILTLWSSHQDPESLDWEF
ncbi:type II toxin-antitoxin system RelE/ParE family toxin [Dyadobacter alkalitolerans]|uniref:type II toxin-antitoxin system RelE/ParE family toxin n=1 Tax=Dyadobacter alkalitolerans TaxID=492736 RepID=UPI000412D601|nr:type II toxin-antitoxin system RelE/ParE family toxin [Dyadobacter alkalitolerans]